MEQLVFDEPLLRDAHRLTKRMTQYNICLYLTGLAASGKSTVAEYVSALTGIPLVDTGLPFRLATYLYRHVPACAADKNLLERVLKAHSIQIVHGQYRVFSGSEDITERLRGADIDREVPRVAGDPRVRELVLGFLRSTTTAPAIVAARGATEALTAGHILQLELSAAFDCRVRRRTKQGSIGAEVVRKSIRERDRRDLQGASRYPSPDIIDTTHLTLEESVAGVIGRANERLLRLYEFRRFRRVRLPADGEMENPLLQVAWDAARPIVTELEKSNGVPIGQTRGQFLLGLSRFSTRDLFGASFRKGDAWPASTFPRPSDLSHLTVNEDLLVAEAGRAVAHRRASIERFFESTRLPRAFMEAGPERNAVRKGGKLVVEGGVGKSEQLVLKDASPELGLAIETHLHYLGAPRSDATHRIVLVEESTDLPILYLSFSPNSRKYTEPLLWAFGLRMEEVAVAVRGYGSPRCPRNAMGLFLRLACNKIAADFPHLRAVLTDINPNWGFGGQSFREGHFEEIGLKHAPTSFVGDDYVSRRELGSRKGSKAATGSRIPLVPTLIMLHPLQEAVGRQIKASATDGIYVVPRSMYSRG